MNGSVRSIYQQQLDKLNTQLTTYVKTIQIGGAIGPHLPSDFVEFNRIVYPPIHPATKLPTDMYDFQIKYWKSIMENHKVILNKSRKIGATETALRTILYKTLLGFYSGQKVMIVAGNNQTIANKFISRLMKMLSKDFIDLSGKRWNKRNLLKDHNSRYMKFFNNTEIEAYPANEGVRGEENVICVFMSEAAFSGLSNDTPIFNALKPNVINIPHADFILESTPNGKRGFFYRIFQDAIKNSNEFSPLEIPYTEALDKLLPSSVIEAEKNNVEIDFEQEYCCKFTTSLSAAFREADVEKNFIKQKTNDWSDIL